MNSPDIRTPIVPRRGVMVAAAAGLLGAVALPTSASASSNVPASAASTADVPASNVPVLSPGADWNAALASTPVVQLVPGATYTLEATVSLPDGAMIFGNGATVTVADPSLTALHIDRKARVSLFDIRFRGRADDPIGMAHVPSHVGVRVTRGVDVTIERCDFENWLGAGLVITGSASDDVFRSGAKVTRCRFKHCYFGASIADRAEYGLLTENHFLGCRLGLWNSSGNWMISANTFSSCYGAIYVIAKTSPYGALASDNWAHGNISSNIINHSSAGGGPRWTGNAAFTIGGAVQDPGSGVVVSGLIPPTFTANALWYSNLQGIDLQGTRWLISGCTLSNLSITASGNVPIHLVGTQSNGTANAPVLSGNVKDLLAL